MTQEEIYLFMEEFRRVYGDIAKDIEVQIIALIENEVEPHKAIAEVMKRQPPAMGLSPPLSELLVSATINGSGRKRSEFTKSMIKSMKEAVINQPWTPDNMGLSKRLHKINDVMRQALNDEIQKAMRNGTNWVDISRKIYSGYGAGGKLKKAEELPNYMKEILRSATKVIDDPEEIKKFREFIRKMQRRLERIQTPGLQAAYSELIHAAETGKEKAIKRAIRTALEERSRYYAERIARTELARAWADGFYAKTLPDEDVIAYKWKLSSNHPIRDICDFHAVANLYGLGAGVYPKDRMPRLPAHPHCRCRIMEVFDGELDGKTRCDDEVQERGQKLLKSLPPKEQEKLLGVEGAKKWREGDDWQKRLVGWSGHETPQTRLDKIFSVLPSADKALIPEAKIFNYALDKTNAVGKNKAIVFESALGYNQSNGNLLIEAIRNNLRQFRSIKATNDQYGDRYNVIMQIKGANGKTANILTAWMVRKGEDFPRLTTLYVTDKEAKHIGN